MADRIPKTQTHAPSADRRRNAMPRPLLVVTIDRLPAWMLPPYGATWVAMPAMSELAARGVVFDGVVGLSDDPRDAVRSLMGWLAAASGCQAAVVTDEPAIAAVVGFGDVTVVEPAPEPRQAADAQATDLARLFAAASVAVARREHDVVWCHAGSLGSTWDAPEEFRDAYLDPEDPPPPGGAAVPRLVVAADTDPDLVTGLRHVFAGQLTLLDRCLAALLEAAGDETTILLAGLRGMPLGLHGRFGPGPALPHSDIVRVPGILVDARGRMAGQRLAGLATLDDLGATLADLATGSVPPDGRAWAGRSLAGLFDTWSDRGRDRVIVAGEAGVAVVTPAWHFVMPAGDAAPRSLYAKPDDFFDLCDVADRCRAVVDDLGGCAEAAAQGDLATAWERPLGAGSRPAE